MYFHSNCSVYNVPLLVAKNNIPNWIWICLSMHNKSQEVRRAHNALHMFELNAYGGS